MKETDLLIPSWISAHYLARIACNNPEAVVKTILDLKLSFDRLDSFAVIEEYVKAANQMPVELGAKLIPKIKKERWIENCHDRLLHRSLNGFLKKLIVGNRLKESLELAIILLDIRAGDETNKSLGINSAVGYLDDLAYSEVVEALSLVPPGELPSFLRVLVKILCKIISLEQTDTNSEDYSYIWRPAIEDHKQNLNHQSLKHSLVTAIRDLLEKYVAHLKATEEPNASRIIDNLLGSDSRFSIITRLKIHLYRLYSEIFRTDIEKIVFGYFFDYVGVWHEYALLLGQAFPNFDQRLKNRYFRLVARGPKGETDSDYIRRWKVRKLSIIKNHLPLEQLKLYKRLVEGREEPLHPELLTITTDERGPTSPSTEKDLASMPLPQLLQYLTSWAPENSHFTPSRHGLGIALATMIKNKAEEYSQHASIFLDPKLRPVYLHSFFGGMIDGLANGSAIDWSKILNLMTGLVERAMAGTLSSYDPGSGEWEWETKWEGVFQSIGKLLEEGLRHPKAGLGFDHRKQIWQIITFLCEHPQPTQDFETKYGGNNSDPFTMSLNTVRGQAFHALFAYVFWCNRYLRTKSSTVNIVVEEVKPLLERHLDVLHDPSLAIRSVYGKYFPWLYLYGPKWSSSLIDRLFPKDDKARRYAAWETYLSNIVIQDVFIALKPKYEQAISELGGGIPKRSYWVEPGKRLAEHMMIAYAYNVDKAEDPVYLQFFRQADSKYRGKAIALAGRAYLTRADSMAKSEMPDLERLQEFWEWRLSFTVDVDELQEFGWWVAKDIFDNKWLLEKLIQTLKQTNGMISRDFLVAGTLAHLCEQFSTLCAEALYLIIKSRKIDRLYALDHAKDN